MLWLWIPLYILGIIITAACIKVFTDAFDNKPYEDAFGFGVIASLLFPITALLSICALIYLLLVKFIQWVKKRFVDEPKLGYKRIIENVMSLDCVCGKCLKCRAN